MSNIEQFMIEEAEDITLDSLPYDLRFEGLSAATRDVIDQIYHGDIDSAGYWAERFVNSLVQPYDWAVELHHHLMEIRHAGQTPTT